MSTTSRSPMNSVPKNDGHDQERLNAAVTKRIRKEARRSINDWKRIRVKP